MDSLNEFLQVAKERNYQVDEYPYSEKGPVKMNKIVSYVTYIFASISVIIAMSVCLMIFDNRQPVIKPDRQSQVISVDDPDTRDDKTKAVDTAKYMEEKGYTSGAQRIMYYLTLNGISWDDLKQWAKDALINIMIFIRRLAVWAIFVFLALIAFTWLTYSVNIVKRWRNYERDVVSNDFEAVMLKRKILRSVDFRKQYVGARRARDAQKEFDPKKDGRVESLIAFKNMKVYVNTRQSLDGFNIIKCSRIIFDVPFNEFALEDLENQIKNINNIATRKTKAVSKFGTIETSEDRQHWTVRAQSVVPDKYLYDTEEVEVDTTEYQSSFPLNLLVDRRDAIQAIKDKTNLYARRTSETMAMLLTSSRYQVKFVSFVVSASTVTFTYEWTFDTQAPNIQSLPKTIDKTFGVSGSEVTLSGSYLQIVVPLDSQYQIPIDVATMYRAVFGGNEE